MILGGGCAPLSQVGSSPLPTYPLVITNKSDFEVVVYAVSALGDRGVRLGNAMSFATTRLKVPQNVVQAGGALVLGLHGIGTGGAARYWTSPSIQMDSTVVAQLVIQADAYGDLTHSQLFTTIGGIRRR
jgi:hypothetical protein